MLQSSTTQQQLAATLEHSKLLPKAEPLELNQIAKA